MSEILHGEARANAVSDLAEFDDRFRVIFDAVNDGIFIIDPATTQFIEVNEAGCRMFGYTRAEVLSRSIGLLSSGVPPYTRETAMALSAKAQAGDPQLFEWQCKRHNGELFWAEMSLSFTKIGHTPALVTIVRDITERKELDERFRQLAENISEVFWMSNPDKSAMLYVSPGYETIWGRSCQSLYDNPRQWLDAIHERDRDRVAKAAKRQVHGDYDEEYRIVRPDGQVRWISDRAFPVRDSNGKVYRIAGVARDITERKRLDAEIAHMAHHDSLTGLANRENFTSLLERAIARSRHSGGRLAVLFLDLDRFKDVNDTRGHAVGDRLLQLVAERLQAGVRFNENVARFGGDEFAVLLSDPLDPEAIAAFASRLITSVSEPYVIDGIESYVDASVGVAISGKDGDDAETLMSHADMALYRAKAEGRRTYRFFSRAMHEEVQARVRMTNELRLAIPDGQLFLVYQPQVDTRDGRIIGVEALVRWRHPRHGVLAPDQFLPIAEDSGLVAPLGEWVLREACRQGRQWIDARVAPGRISVNLSGHQLKDPLALEKQVFDILQETGLPAHLLELEVMESALMELTPQQDEMIQRLRSAGIRLALDDFGTGNSALNYLRRFPIDQIKIAREFISELDEDSRDASIVKLILGLAREYDSEVMAEGVETSRQIHLLRGWGCTGIQGFYFSRPVSAGAMETALLKDRKMNRPAKADFAA